MPHAPHTLVEVRDLTLFLDQLAEPDPAPALRRLAAAKLSVAETSLGEVVIVRRALDSRHQKPRFVFAVQLALPAPQAEKLIGRRLCEPAAIPPHERWRMTRKLDGPRPVVVGAGPAGLFAALTLAEAGLPPILVERGKMVEERSHDVSALYREGSLDRDSNVCYGEGGAGTYSDGKLYTRVGDARVRAFMEKLVEHGADPDILVNARPHLGTDRLIDLMQRTRARLLELGTELRYGCRLEDFVVRDGALRGLSLSNGESLDVDRLVLATGHSARHVWERLHANGFTLETRAFAVGFRVEHPQGLIDEIQYGRAAGHPALPAADYRVAHNEPNGRGVYSFCMCPGGVVVTTPTEEGELCINGMSHAARAGRYANSALVVSVTPEDFAAAGHTGVFAGVGFQQAAERAAYQAGGGKFVAPAQRLSDFVEGRATAELPHTSYRRGIVPADLGTLYPRPVIDALRNAVRVFAKKMRGFVSDEAKLIGVETRTASPIRVVRGADLQSVAVRGVYPAGEGMGYGGGIASAAVDGMRVAEALLEQAGAERRAVD